MGSIIQFTACRGYYRPQTEAKKEVTCPRSLSSLVSAIGVEARQFNSRIMEAYVCIW